jgi:hypothetical protein
MQLQALEDLTRRSYSVSETLWEMLNKIRDLFGNVYRVKTTPRKRSNNLGVPLGAVTTALPDVFIGCGNDEKNQRKKLSANTKQGESLDLLLVVFPQIYGIFLPFL